MVGTNVRAPTDLEAWRTVHWLRPNGRRLQFACLIVLHAVIGDALGASPDGYRAYPLSSVRASQVAPQLEDLLSTLPEAPEIVVDSHDRRVLVRGTEQAHALTTQFLKLVDCAVETRQPATPSLRAYRIGPQLSDVATRVQQQYAGRTDVRVSSDARTGQLLVLAPPDVQSEIARSLGQRGLAPGGQKTPAGDRPGLPGSLPRPLAAPPAPHSLTAGSQSAAMASQTPLAGPKSPPSGPTTVQQQAPPSAPVATATATQPKQPPARADATMNGRSQTGRMPNSQVLSLSHITWQAMHGGLERLLEDRLPTTTQRSEQGESVTFEMQAAPGAQVRVEVDPQTRQVTLRGRPELVRSWVQVIRALDAPANAPADKTELIAVKASQPGQLNRALTAIQAGAAPRPAGRDRMVAMLFQPKDPSREPDAQAPGEEAGQDGTAAASGPAATDTQLLSGGAIGPVDIQFLEGSDVIVIRGHERDVARVRQLIEQIEQLSLETQPEIVVRPLQHAAGEAMAVLLNGLYDEVFLARQGAVSITPLVKPNALLLVGREENVKTVIDLVDKLDRPVAPATQSRVYRLKHASALEAKTTIDEYLGTVTDEEQPGLAVRARITADFRSNSLIVQASPRDVAEIASLITRIDTGTSEAVNELRIFQLENALAEELVETLRSAVEQQQGQAAVAGTPGPAGGNAATRAAAAATRGGQQQARSTALTFLSIDGQGQQRLRSGILTDVRITADPRTNTVVVSAPNESMGLIAALIRSLDQIPAPEAQIKVFTIVNGDATTLADILEELFGQQRGAAAGATTTPGEAGSLLVQMRFSVDERTNSIITSGMPNDLVVAEAILLRLDESDVRQRKTTVYRLKNSPAEAVSEAVNEWLRSEREMEQLTPDVTSPFQQIEREVVVVPELVSNSLIVSATPRYYEEIRTLIEQLDQRPPMVMIQVVIAEVALRDTDEFGVELGLQDGLLFDRSIVESLLTTTTTEIVQGEGGQTNTLTQDTIVSAPIAPGFNFNNSNPLGNNGGDKALAHASNVAGQALSNFSVGRMNGELGYGGLVLSAASSSVNVLLRALQDCRSLKVLSRPQIMTLDTQPAYIQVGQDVPRIVGTSVDLGVQQNQIVDTQVGIILAVRPLISPDGLVVMEIDATKSVVGPESEGIPISINAVGDVVRSPRIDKIFAQTTVAAVTGQTIVLAGLITTRDENTHRRVPFLSSIPVLGHLFRYDMVAEQRTELLIVLTPTIVKDQADADAIKQVEAARMSWCLSDVVEVHGPMGLRGRGDAWSDDETATFYPGLGPHGAEPIPTPAGEVLTPPADMLMPEPQLPIPAKEWPTQDHRLPDVPSTLPLGDPSPRSEREVVPGNTRIPVDGPNGHAGRLGAHRGKRTGSRVEPAAYERPGNAHPNARWTAQPAIVHLPRVDERAE